MTRSPLAIIAGTGFYDLDALENPTQETVDTVWGQARVTKGEWHGIPVVFLTRHGAGHSVPPHLVNYRANIRALADLGVRDVVAVNVTGSIDPTLQPGDLLCLDDFVDFTKQRPVTFFDGSTPEGVVHTDVMTPYHPAIRREILDAAATSGHTIRDGGVYACFEGPRFETRAEIRLAALAGADVAGMTGVPEVTLAVEAGLRYAAISLVVNPASGVGDADEPITMDEINAVLAASSATVLEILDDLVHTRATFPEEPDA
ncbi:S-methyl-5'-thioinosine phosphorylase [Ornithinibacter sp.]|jgi:5'-deoxy-5'-methylthioadenosine phosphorylase|uniref:S-methyl-5'-thioinosine phosphorylase n=1 Tax=Ornithinibacter sp. TaxID=2862748 RepID=UPI001B4E2529|nr:S-methyl-5'-thioinosine phosphorylase [Ornithinibacter sp.]MBP6526055.1 S-methyl-5'-thioinosine phosphorylase [Dermatophilaceae bacterium]MBU9944116.1 S-methyl-5'-thioinosine phosphorylase [Dermatophilaceae bacterium]HQW74012.1 S-methyl-5'-thioinosine phosphorylase [Ornithinibacter sp.]HQX87580.1 S-methyl-5'-thioinosine phosphorylase [Ornithinibacter sp.]HQZ10327.1 S-methyl-5'-thioinosine phosphorylase [Ornithinibacter sp.]